MSQLTDKYAAVIAAAQNANIDNLSVQEQDGILYISGTTNSTDTKDLVWNALETVDATFTATDINVDIQVTGIPAGTNLTVVTEQSNLNIRKEPSTEADVVGKAGKGEIVTLVEVATGDWWKIKTKDGEEGYAYARYLKVN
ncbi:SH3 domain-containing protein [Riemerella columbina]|uniref:SH3 domain-containing protein n=1 Tax=Riemerella columbina TaxID=103810 RepID=UPI00266EBE95|nr:SH3 domain-containing protein [Riemerella columbina]WKS94417.1 SH3 domain-containing protein [Riemerella columbina]